MREDGPDDRPTGTPGAGPPSARARADLRADLRREVTDARLRFEEAGMRAEAHRLLGDDRAAAEVVDEQQQVLVDLERRLGRVVSAAVLQRDAEEVLAGVPSAADAPPESPAAAGPARRRMPALSGVASALAVVAVAALAVLGVPDSPPRLDVLGAADPADEQSTDDPTGDAPSQGPVRSSPDAAPDEGHAVTSSASTADPATERPSLADGPTASAGSSTDAEEPTRERTEASLDQLVAGIGDALRQLGSDDDPDLPGDGDTERASSLEEVVDDEVDREQDTEPTSTETTESVDVDGETEDDGFVSDAGAE